MVTKALKRKEVELGFVHIPAKNRAEFLGEKIAPFETKLNSLPAKVDKFGRIWSSYLKQRYPVDTQITIIKNDSGFEITSPLDQVKENAASEIMQHGVSQEILTVQEKTLCEMPAKPANGAIMRQKESEISMLPKEDFQISYGKPYFQANSIYIFNDDILKTESIKDKSVDLIVTSPPYCVAVEYEKYDDNIPYDQYLLFTRKWLQKCFDLAKDDGRLCLNLPLDKNKGGQQSVYADVTGIAKEIGWKYHSTIIWNEQNMSRRTAWGSWLSASAPFVIAPVEVIIVMYRKSWRKLQRGKSDITKEEFIEWTNGVWNFSGESKSRVGHPAPFPVELPKRCIKLFSYVGSAVLDPFLGSGTTLIACMETNRLGLGVEIDTKYCDLAVKRLKKSGLFQKKLDSQ
jgi:site-specific DNA-methyltransferase (adenine-specific)